MLQIHKASAGSGKTFNLARQYILFLIAYKGDDGRYRLRTKPMSDHSRILAITFTNKATNEMTNRIIKELAALAGMPTDEEFAELLRKNGIDPAGASPDDATLLSPYARDFLDPETGLGCTPDQLRETSRAALINLLYDYSYFNVSTIDSFFQSVLRMFTREVEIPENYNVELNDTLAITIGVNEMINSLNYPTIAGTPEDVKKGWVNDWLYRFMKDKMSEGSKFNLFSHSSQLYGTLIKDLGELSKEEFKNRRDKLLPYFDDLSRIKRFADEVSRRYYESKNGVRELAVQLLKLESQPDDYSRNFYSALTKLADGQLLKSDATVRNVAAGDIAKATKKEKTGYRLSPDLLDKCVELSQAYVDFTSLDDNLKPVLDRVYIFGLLSTVMKHIDDYCRDNSLILLSQTNNILKGLINDDETPFIYERLGYYLDHFLIDEFQDTSAMQWDNLRPLVMESLSRNCDNLIIGDEKQSIYGFRNADPRLLGHKVKNETEARFAGAPITDVKGEDIDENCNWRTAGEIVVFNNTLFTAMARALDAYTGIGAGCLPDMPSAAATYANVIQKVPGHGRHGYVKVVIGKKPEQKPDVDPALEFMTAEIKRLFATGYRPGDIAVLVRDHDKGQAVIDHLLKLMNDPAERMPSFHILSDDNIDLSSSQAVRLIVSILRLVSLPEFLETDAKAMSRVESTPPPERQQSDSYRRARLVNRFQFYIHQTHRDGTSLTPSEALEKALADNRTPDDENDNAAMRSLLDMDCLNLPAVVERIIHTYIPPQLKVDDNLFITTFQDLVYDFSSRGNHDIRRFLDWWDRTGCQSRVTLPADSDALTVMTIHKAKGLEFPCVIIPYATGDMFKTGSTAWIDLPAGYFAGLGIDEASVPPAMPLKIGQSMIERGSVYADECRRVIASGKIEELNVAYVAFTRPKSELMVYVPYTNRTADLGSYLRNALQSATQEYLDGLDISPDKRAWLKAMPTISADDTYTVGSPTTPRHEDNKADNSFEMESYQTRESSERAKARTGCDDPVIFYPDSQRHVGTFLHSVMNLVTEPSRLPYAIRHQAYRYRLPKAMADKMQKRLEKALANPDAARWFDGFTRVITERSVTSRNDTRRPDRLVWLPDGTVEVVDYKFVDHLPSNLKTDSKHAGYVGQVERYCNYVKGSTHAPVKGYIWYISPDDNIITPI